MADLNKVIIIGRLTHDPDLRFIPTGSAVCSFSVAVNRAFKNKEGTKETDFINIVTWQKLAERCGKYLARGSQVGLHGRLQIRTYETSAGERRKIAEVVADNVEFLSGIKGREFSSGTEAPRERKPLLAKSGDTEAPPEELSKELSGKPEKDLPPSDDVFSDDDLGIDPDDIPF